MKKSYLAHGDFVHRHADVPVFVRAHGPILEAADGARYFDAEAANGTASLGYDSKILEESQKKIAHLPSLPSFCESEIRLHVAEKIGRLINQAAGKRGRIAFELGGAQGIELAIRVVKTNKKKTQIVVFEGGYHGRSIYTSQLSASHRYRESLGDWRVPVVRLPYPGSSRTYSAALRDQHLERLRSLTKNEYAGMIGKTGPDIAAFVFEPVLNAGGIVQMDKEYIQEAVRVFRNLGALIVVDEIFCGLYRTGTLFGFEHYNISPDIIVMSKAITNGITPLSCVWARDPYMLPDHFPPGTHSATFINNPLALAVADTVLGRFENWKSRKRDIRRLEKSLDAMIQTVVKSSKHVISGYALGGVGRIVLKENKAPVILKIARNVGKRRRIEGFHGLLVASTGMTPNIIALNPPLTVTENEQRCLHRLFLETFKSADKIL